MRRIRLTTTLVAIPLAAAACGTATTSSSPTGPGAPVHSGDGSTTTPRGYADRLLDVVQVPASARTADRAPSKVLESLPESPSLDGTPLVVKRFWTVDDSALAVYTWLRDHRPGMTLESTGGSPSTKPTTAASQYLGYRDVHLPAGIGAGYLYLTVVPTGPRTAAIGAYAVTVPQPPRPADEQIPVDGTRVVIRWALAPGGTPVLKPLAGSAAADLTRDFNALRVDTEGKVLCPMIPQQDANIVVTFRTDGHSWRATIPACPDIDVTRDGQDLPALAFGNPFLSDVKSYTGYLPQLGLPHAPGGVTPLVQPRSH